jgi:DNA-binding transcriptional MocR family regulator
VLERPGIVSFAGGIPDPALFPLREAEAAFRGVLGDPRTAAAGLQYAISEGYPPLRQWIVRHMATLGVPCTEDNVLITSGSQQGLEFLARLLLSAGDTALVTAPTYLGALQAFAAYEPRFCELHLERGEPTAKDYREGARAAGGRVKLAYVVADFANPTGATLSLQAREHLLDLAQELDIPLIEDGAYRALSFEGVLPPTLSALEIARCGSIEAARTVYCGTFSKVLAPGLRIGWIVAGAALIRRLVLVKQASDLNSSSLNQMVMHRLAEAAFERQVVRAQVHYRQRRDALLAALTKYMPTGVRWTRPGGGLFVWLNLPEHIDAAALLAAALDVGVAFVPGAAFFFDGRTRNSARLSYSLPPEEEIEGGIARLSQILAERC